MSKTIQLKIDVLKIDKTKLFKGEKGTYLDAVLFLNDEADQYGNNGMIVQSVTKEEREKGVKGAILGNCKVFGAQPQQHATAPQAGTTATPPDDLPF